MKLLVLILLTIQFSFAQNACIMESFDQEVVNTAASLKEIEQADLIKGQCRIYKREFRKRRRGKSKLNDTEYNRAMVLCGKWIFQNLGMRTKVGIPLKILKMMESFPEVGKKLSKIGLLTDESWKKERWPYGLVKARHHSPFSFKKVNVNRVLQISCAGCHTSQLPDGRFSIGGANEKFNYGKFNLYTLFSIWLTDKRKYDKTRWIPELIEKYTALKKSGSSKVIKMLNRISYLPANSFVIKYLIGEEPPPLKTQRAFLKAAPGIYNGFAPSVNFIDKNLELTAPQIWNMGEAKEAHYGSLAGLEDLDKFISEAVIYTTRSSKYIKELYIAPIREFLKCLKAPKRLEQKDIILHERGKALFKNNCASCHDLANGGGSKTFEPKTISFPTTYMNIFVSYTPTDVQSYRTYREIKKNNLHHSTSKVKVRRLRGIWTRSLLTANGKAASLDELLCINSDGKSSSQRVGIHSELCNDKYTNQDKNSLKEYLLNF